MMSNKQRFNSYDNDDLIIDKRTDMKRNLFFIFGHLVVISILATSTPTYAEFVSTYTDGKQKAWVDTSSKEGSGNIRRIMELINYKDKQVPRPGFEYSSMLYQYQFDCKQKSFKVLMSVAFEKHQGQGRVIFRDDTATPSYIGIKDGSSVYEAFVIACR
jgi:hypothetical protein